MRLCPVATVLAVLIGFIHSPAQAQYYPTTPAIPPEASAGWYLVPSLALTEEFDDNIFATHSNRQWDIVSRFSPGLAGGYRSDPLTVIANAGFDAEVYPRHSDLNDATAGWHTGLTARYLPIRPLTLGFDLAYVDTRTPTTLPVTLAPTLVAPATVLQFGLRRATFLTASPSLAYQFSPITTGTASYSYTRDTIQGGVDTQAHTALFGLSHDFTRLDTGRLGFRSSVYETGSTTTEDYAPTVGYTRKLTPETSISLDGGPRFTSDGSVGPEVSARLDHRFKEGTAFLSYARSQGFVLGEVGVVETETYSAGVSAEPMKSLLVTVAPTVERLFGTSTGDLTLYGLVTTASYRILRWLTGRASYQFYYQDQRGSIYRNIFSFSLEASYPYRFGE